MSYEYQMLREQNKRDTANLYYEQPASEVDVSEGRTLADDYLEDLRKLGATTRDDIIEYFNKRNLPWGLPSDNVISWLETKLSKGE